MRNIYCLLLWFLHVFMYVPVFDCGILHARVCMYACGVLCMCLCVSVSWTHSRHSSCQVSSLSIFYLPISVYQYILLVRHPIQKKKWAALLEWFISISFYLLDETFFDRIFCLRFIPFKCHSTFELFVWLQKHAIRTRIGFAKNSMHKSNFIWQ